MHSSIVLLFTTFKSLYFSYKSILSSYFFFNALKFDVSGLLLVGVSNSSGLSMKMINPFCFKLLILSLLSIAPPPVEITIPFCLDKFFNTSLSIFLKFNSPLLLMKSNIDVLIIFSISLSESKNSLSSLFEII